MTLEPTFSSQRKLKTRVNIHPQEDSVGCNRLLCSSLFCSTPVTKVDICLENMVSILEMDNTRNDYNYIGHCKTI